MLVNWHLGRDHILLSSEKCWEQEKEEPQDAEFKVGKYYMDFVSPRI